MTHWTEAAELLDERESAPQSAAARYTPGVFAFVMSAALGVYIVCLRPVLFASNPPPAERLQLKTEAFGGLSPLVLPPSVALTPNSDGGPFGQIETDGLGGASDGSSKFALSENPVPLPPVAPQDLRTPTDDESAPLPPRRPNELARTPSRPADSNVARLDPRPVAPAPAPAATPGLFEKLFGGAASNARSPEQLPQMAYAAPPPVSSALSAVASGRGSTPGAGMPGGFLHGLTFGDGAPARYGDHAAIYDISAHVVYLPDGTKLEAHSGMGGLRDDPNGVSERMRGATPPATYALTPREASFHGVDALRLTPIDSGVYGRAGLLAHSYMLGPDGDSNGCVSFRDYEAFLRAYRSGQITKLVVVTRL